MRIRFSLIPLLATLATPLASQEEAEGFCFAPPYDRLCPIFPEDIPAFSDFFEYMVISGAAQAPFDRHAWQAFVALNWQDVANGPKHAGWRAFPSRDAVIGRDSARDCAPYAGQAEVTVTDLEQSDGNPLVDRNGNYVLYETRMNHVAADYVWQTTLEEIARDETVEIDFPQGRDADQPASVFLKTSWTVLSSPSDRHITASGLIVVPADRSQTGATLCVRARLGLIGMHIVTKVASGNGDEWVWATFEHRANAPTASDARDINAIYGPDLFPEGCVAPRAVADDMLLFDALRSSPANTPPAAAALWSAEPPHAVDAAGDPLPASQVVRCWEIFGPTQATNARWQAELKGTPLENYMLISAQWRGANISPYLEHGELPRFLSNVTMETYLQTDREGTCLGCHADAVTAAGAPSDFTFVLREIPK